MFDVTKLPVDKQFTKRLIRPDTWIINPWDENNAAPHPYVIVGEEKAMLIDSTWTELPLREYIEKCVTDKPLIVVNTHGHHDHTNANWMFEDLPIYMSEYAFNEILDRRKLPFEEGRWGGNKPGNYTANIAKAGDTFDLGGRIIEVLPYKGSHSPGSLLYLDQKYGLLFPGDEIECGQMLVSGTRYPGICVEYLRENLLGLIEGWGDKIDLICPPHNGAPIDGSFLNLLVENCDRIMSGVPGNPDVGSTSYLYNPLEDRSPETVKAIIDDPKMMRAEWKGTSIVYNTDRIFKSQL